MRRLLQVLFWSVIAAAFVGPGTVTTCARAGVEHGHALLWAVAFSALTCFLLQEAAGRLTAVSGSELGQALLERFRSGAAGVGVLLLVLGAIVVGCAAYQAGNLLGAALGAGLAVRAPHALLVTLCVLPASLLLWFARTRTVARVMGLIVAGMGLAFLSGAVLLGPDPASLARGLTIPSVPDGSGLLVIGLVGTTVVPYNLFLGSGLARGRPAAEMRFGLAVAIGLGGLISMGVLVVGAAVPPPFTLDALAATLSERLGGWAGWMFATGLFCAGFTSAITAPLAAAITARGLFSRAGDPRWDERGLRYRAVWSVVMVTGAGFALAAARPVQVIVLAQALNGLLLPFVAVFLLLEVNDPLRMGRRINGRLHNLALGAVIAVALLLGLSNLVRALAAIPGAPALAPETVWITSAALAALLALPVGTRLKRLRARPARSAEGSGP